MIQEFVKVDVQKAAETAEQERAAGRTPEKEIAAQPGTKQKGKRGAARQAANPPPAGALSLTRFRAVFRIFLYSKLFDQANFSKLSPSAGAAFKGLRICLSLIPAS